MNTENHTCLTDAEFIRMHEYSSDPLLRQACARLDRTFEINDMLREAINELRGAAGQAARMADDLLELL